MTPTSWTPAPSSVNSRTPRAASSPMGARRSPARPTVMAPATATWHMAAVPERQHLEGHRGAVDGGVGVGHGHHGREPAERRPPGPPLSTVSASSAPGWRRWVWRSTSPGATRQPPASSTVAPAGDVERRARRRVTSPVADHDVGPAHAPGVDDRAAPDDDGRVADGGAPDRGLRHRGRPRSIPVGPAAPRLEPTWPCPSNRKSTAMRTATPLDTWRNTSDRGRSATSSAISTPRFIGPGCMTSASSRSRPARRGRQPVASACTRAPTAGRPRPPFGLQPQEIADVDVGAARRRGRADLRHRPALERRGQQAARGHQRHLGPQGGQGQHHRSGPPGCGPRRPRWPPAGPTKHPTPASLDRAPGPLGQHLADRVAVEQGLGGVLVPPVAGVDDAGVHPARHRAGAPAEAWRTTKASTPMAATVSTVSRSDSPFFTDEEATANDRARRPTGAWPPSRTTGGSGWTPRRTASPPSAPAGPAPWGWAGGPPRRRRRTPRRISSIPSAPRSAMDSR